MEQNAMIQEIANTIQEKIDLVNTGLADEYFYSSLPLCIIDAIFSISVTYTSTRNTVFRFCDYFGIERISKHRISDDEFPSLDTQLSVNKFLSFYQKMSSEDMAIQVYKNRQRTSSTNGILKSEAVRLFGLALQEVGVNYFQDLENYDLDKDLLPKIRSIPGQKSGISYSYFLMLCGNKNLVKPDRMVRSFLRTIIGKTPSEEESQSLLSNTHILLREKYPNLTLREIDYAIWSFQRNTK